MTDVDEGSFLSGGLSGVYSVRTTSLTRDSIEKSLYTIWELFAKSICKEYKLFFKGFSNDYNIRQLRISYYQNSDTYYLCQTI